MMEVSQVLVDLETRGDLKTMANDPALVGTITATAPPPVASTTTTQTAAPAPQPVPVPTPRPAAADQLPTASHMAAVNTELNETGTQPDLKALRQNLSPNQILKLGSKGQSVSDVQTLLNAQGANIDVDGKYGAKTAKAVRDFQTQQHLRQDGRAGQETIGRLKLGATGPAVDANQMAPGTEQKTTSGQDGVQIDAKKKDDGTPEATLTAPQQASMPTTVTGTGTGQTVAVPTENGGAALQLTGAQDKLTAGFNGAPGDHQIVTMDKDGGTEIQSTPATVVENGPQRTTTTPGTQSVVTRDPGMYESISNALFGAPQSTQTGVVDQKRILGGYADTTQNGATVDHTRLSTAMDDLDAQRMQTAMDMAKAAQDPNASFWTRFTNMYGAGMMMGGGQ